MVELKGQRPDSAQKPHNALWARFEAECPDLFRLLSRMRVSFVIGIHRETEFQARAGISVNDFVKRRYGFGGSVQSPTSELGKELGMTTGGVSTLSQGILGYISLETGLPFGYPAGINARNHVDRFAGLVCEQRTLERRMSQGVPPLEREVLRFYLLGYRLDNLAAKLNADLSLVPAVSESLVTTMINQALGRIDRSSTAFFTARTLKARALLQEVQAGTYRNHKAEATIRVLKLLEDECTPDEIVEETGIRAPDYNALVNEAFIDLRADEIGSRDLAEIYGMVGKRPFVPLVNGGKNRAARLLHDPYVQYRARLGDQEATGSGEVIQHRLSFRERAILEAISTGLTRKEVADQFGLGNTYCTAVTRWLLGETSFVSRSERLAERKRAFTGLQDDIRKGNLIPERLLVFAGLPSTVMLGMLADGFTILQTAQAVSEQSRLPITTQNVIDFYARVRARYH